MQGGPPQEVALLRSRRQRFSYPLPLVRGMENRSLPEQQRNLFLLLREKVNSQVNLASIDATLAWQEALGSKAGQTINVSTLLDAFRILGLQGIDLVGKCGWVFHHPTS